MNLTSITEWLADALDAIRNPSPLAESMFLACVIPGSFLLLAWILW